MGTLVKDARAELVKKREEAAALGIEVSGEPVEALGALDAICEMGRLVREIEAVRAAEKAAAGRWWERD